MGAMSVPVLIAKAKATAIQNQLKGRGRTGGREDKEEEQQQVEEGAMVVVTSDQIVLFQNKVRSS